MAGIVDSDLVPIEKGQSLLTDLFRFARTPLMLAVTFNGIPSLAFRKKTTWDIRVAISG